MGFSQVKRMIPFPPNPRRRNIADTISWESGRRFSCSQYVSHLLDHPTLPHHPSPRTPKHQSLTPPPFTSRNVPPNLTPPPNSPPHTPTSLPPLPTTLPLRHLPRRRPALLSLPPPRRGRNIPLHLPQYRCHERRHRHPHLS